jgi:hypothetical protein
MSRKWFFLVAWGVFLVAAAVLVATSIAHAQCGDTPKDSSCITCHEYQQADPVYGKGEWHEIHASKDCCWSCHGGNTQAQDKDLAHVGMTTKPLQDIYTDCHSCHPDDYPERAQRFAVVLGVVPGSAPTPTAVAVALAEYNPIVILPPAPVPVAPTPWLAAALGALILGILLISGAWLVHTRMQISRQ